MKSSIYQYYVGISNIYYKLRNYAPHCHQFRHFENPLSPYGDDVICEWYHIEDSLVGHSLAQLSRHLNIASKLCATGIRAQKLIREKEILSNAHRYMHSTYIILCIQYIIDSTKTQNVFHTNVFAIHLPHVSKILSPHNIQKLASLLLTSCLLSKRVVKIFSLVLILL